MDWTTSGTEGGSTTVVGCGVDGDNGRRGDEEEWFVGGDDGAVGMETVEVTVLVRERSSSLLE